MRLPDILHIARARWRERYRAYATDDQVAQLGYDMAHAVAAPVPPWRDAPAASGHRHLIPGGQSSCPSCGGRRCRAWREGLDCRHEGATETTAYAAGRPLPRDGRHTVTVRLHAYRRRLRLAYLRQAVTLDPATYAAKLGRAVALTRHVVVTP